MLSVDTANEHLKRAGSNYQAMMADPTDKYLVEMMSKLLDRIEALEKELQDIKER